MHLITLKRTDASEAILIRTDHIRSEIAREELNVFDVNKGVLKYREDG
jgi:hypothetical protein